MPSLKDIRRRITSVQKTQQITRAMRMVAGAKLRRAQTRIEAARPYAERMRATLNNKYLWGPGEPGDQGTGTTADYFAFTFDIPSWTLELEPRNGGVAYGGTGLYRSPDQGETWQSIGLENTGSIGRILIDPADPQRILVAAMGHLWSGGPDRGVYRIDGTDRSEERRVGKECRSRWSPYH